MMEGCGEKERMVRLSTKSKLEHYECEGQYTLFDYLKSIPMVCEFSHHGCNKRELWKVADTLDGIVCPHVCCRQCNMRLCGARCNGSEEPKRSTRIGEGDDYIREHPTCFYVYGHYLDRAQGWHKVPDELPTFTEWTLIDVVLFGKKTNTAWMEHGKWEAKDWTFRSVDERRNTETTEVLAWCIADKEDT